MSIFSRFFSDTPTFFKRVRTIGIALAAIGTAIATAPISLPAGLIAVSGYLITAGTVATIVSQAVQPSPSNTPLDTNDLKKDQVTIDVKPNESKKI